MQAKRALLRLVLALVVLGGVYGGLAAFLGGHVATNATVDGVAIGGMTPEEASTTLKRVLAPTTSRPVRLTVPTGTVDLSPAAAGLEVDLDATLSELSGFTLHPQLLWEHLTGAEDRPLKFRIDRNRLNAAVTTVAGRVDSSVKQGSIAFTGGKAIVVTPRIGRKVQVAQTADAIVSAWPRRQTVKAVMTVTPPKVSAAEISRAGKELAVPAMSAPVTVLAGSPTASRVVLTPRQYAPALSTTLDGRGRIRLTVDTPKLMAVIRDADPDIERRSVDATVRAVAGRPQVVPAVIGTKLNDKSVPAPFLAALTSAKRTAAITVLPAPPTVTTAKAQAWQIKEPISTFATQFPVNPTRTTNIKIAAAALNGTLVRPGEQFSLNAALGERTPAKGYQQAPVIYNGRLVSDYGGGVSQVSTTTFNAAFFAGVKMDQYTPHSFYIARYPEGREATVSWPDVDQKWTNDTGFGILIQTAVQGNSISVTFWGNKTRDVQATKGPRRNVVPPKTIVDAAPGCVPQQPTPGFDVTVSQIIKTGNAPAKTVTFDTHYIPEDSVTCTNPSAP